MIMQHLKELRDLGFTVVLLHHTPKGNDQTYKGSTAIIDLADHVLSLHRVHKFNPGREIDDEEDTQDCLYKFGTQGKTRFEPFHLCLTFNPDCGFELGVDPDAEHLEKIKQCLTVNGRMNQTQIFDWAKAALNIKGKSKIVSLLRKGENKYWSTEHEGRAVYYSELSNCPPIYSEDNRTEEHEPSPVTKTVDASEALQTRAEQELSSCPESSRTA